MKIEATSMDEPHLGKAQTRLGNPDGEARMASFSELESRRGLLRVTRSKEHITVNHSVMNT